MEDNDVRSRSIEMGKALVVMEMNRWEEMRRDVKRI